MKRLTAIIAAVTICSLLSAQTEAEFRSQYERQVKLVGPSGVGVEYIIGKWQKAFPESKDMLGAGISYYFDKSRKEEVVSKDQTSFMGEEPILTLTDSLGRKVNYFREFFYDDEIFSRSVKIADQAIALYPDDLSFRFYKLDALVAYEKESPDMACSELLSLIDYDQSSHPVWKEGDEVVEKDYFKASVQEYCHSFFTIASPASYESFRLVSEKMNKLYPNDTVFLSNLGSYWCVAAQNNSKALSYYKKVLKIDPKDYVAVKNCVLIARKDKNVKMEKKYLPTLIEVTPSEAERRAAQSRLKQL